MSSDPKKKQQELKVHQPLYEVLEVTCNTKQIQSLLQTFKDRGTSNNEISIASRVNSRTIDYVSNKLLSFSRWLTPTNPQHRKYRKAGLWLSLKSETLGVDRGNLDQASAKRGTVIHQVLFGDKARALPDDLEIKVNCAEDAGGLVERIPFGLAVTLEVAEGLPIPIYNEVQTRVRPQVSITPRPAPGS